MGGKIQRGNMFSSIPPLFENEIEETLFEGEGLRIQRVLSCGQSSPRGFWYDQDEDEYVILLSGEAVLYFRDEGEIRMGSGDWIFIPAHKEHRIIYTSRKPKCVWFAIHGDLEPCI